MTFPEAAAGPAAASGFPPGREAPSRADGPPPARAIPGEAWAGTARPGHRAPPLPLLRLAAVLLGLAAAGVPSAGSAAETQVYLSWGSPHGEPSARDTLVRACGDSTRIDTLYLSFEAGEDFPALVAIVGDIEFRPTTGDTLSDYWRFRAEARGPGSCRGEFAGSTRVGCPFPWSSAGMPVVGFLRRDGIGILRFMYAVSVETPTSVRAGERYCLARILFHHPPGGRAGCEPVLRVVWSEAEFANYDPRIERRVLSGRKRPVYLRTP